MSWVWLLAVGMVAAEEPPDCGGLGSHPLSAPQAAGLRLALERELSEGEATHCGYFLRRACLEWEAGEGGGGLRAFELAHRFCGEETAPGPGGGLSARAVASRGRVAARLAGEDYAGAYAAWKDGSAAGGADSAAVAAYAPAVHGGLSLTDFPPEGPEAWRLAPGPWNPELAYWSSIAPGVGFLSIGEGHLAAQHFLIGTSLTALAGWRLWSVFREPGHADRMVASLDAGVVILLWKRYYLGGMKEAGRLARLKNRRHGAARVRERWTAENPFSFPARPSML